MERGLYSRDGLDRYWPSIGHLDASNVLVFCASDTEVLRWEFDFALGNYHVRAETYISIPTLPMIYRTLSSFFLFGFRSIVKQMITNNRLNRCSGNTINELFPTNLPASDNPHTLNKRLKPTLTRPCRMRADLSLIKQLLHYPKERVRKLS